MCLTHLALASSPTLPAEAVFGLAWSPLNKLKVLADAQWTEWSTFDAFIQFVLSKNRTSALPEYPLRYSGNNFILGFGVGFNF